MKAWERKCSGLSEGAGPPAGGTNITVLRERMLLQRRRKTEKLVPEEEKRLSDVLEVDVAPGSVQAGGGGGGEEVGDLARRYAFGRVVA